MSGSRRGRRQRWKIETERQGCGRKKERQGWREKGMGDRSERERWVERQGRKRRSDRGKEKKLQTQKNSWNFILSCFNPVTGNHHSCYGLKRTFGLVKPKFMTLFYRKTFTKLKSTK